MLKQGPEFHFDISGEAANEEMKNNKSQELQL